MAEQYNAFKGCAENVSGTLLSGRKRFGTNVNGSDEDVVNVGGHMTIRDALKLGLLFRKSDGSLAENSKAATATRVNS